MANKMSGELRLDLSAPTTAERIGDLLGHIDELGIDRSYVEITIQFKTGHVGGINEVSSVANGISRVPAGGLELVASWDA